MRNFNTERLKINDAKAQLQNQINLLQQDLERYKQTQKASEKLIYFKEQQIKVLQSVVESITDYSDETDIIFAEQQKEITALKNENFILEGVCLLHGISNFKFYVNASVKYIIYYVKRAYSEGWRQEPIDLQHDNGPIPYIPTHKLITEAKALIHGIQERKKQRT